MDGSKLNIVKGSLSELETLYIVYRNAKLALDQQGIHQWTDVYPSISTVEKDIRDGTLFVLKQGGTIIGAIVLSEVQDIKYQTVEWQLDDSKVLVIHRLAVDPLCQGQGHAQRLMDYAEAFAAKNSYTSIRLDTYSQNNRSINFYLKRNYHIRGQVYFPGREFFFHCLEKEVSP